MDDERSGRAAFLNHRCTGMLAGALALLLAGCDSDPLAIFDPEPPAAETADQADARARSEAAVEAAEDAPTPDLRDVPERPTAPTPASTREKVVEGLIADSRNARYTDEAIRLQGTGRQQSAPPAGAQANSDEPAAAAESAAAAGTSRMAAKADTEPPTDTARDPGEAAPVETPSSDADVARLSSTDQPDVSQPVPPEERLRDTAPAAGAAGTAAAASTSAGAPPPALGEPSPVPPPPAPPAPSDSTPAGSIPSASAPEPGTPAQTRPASRDEVVVDRSALDGVGGNGLPPSGEQVATIQFAHSSSRLDARDREILRQVAAIQRQSGGSVVVVGHASSRTQQLDKVAHEIANLNMSMARANAVADALIESGVSRDLVTVEAVSDEQPMYSESMPTGEAGNRRAEVYLVR